MLARPDVVETAVVRSPVGLMAFHAGLEAGTEEMASGAADLAGASLYVVRQPADLRWHVPSIEVDPGGSESLRSWLGTVRRALALHGYGRPGRDLDVLVGGADPALCAEAAETLGAAVPDLHFVHGSHVPVGLGGRHPANPVNLPPNGGVQLELPVLARRGELSLRLRAALADLARRWAEELLSSQPGSWPPGARR